MTKIPSLPDTVRFFIGLLPGFAYASLTDQLFAVLDEVQVRRRRFQSALSATHALMEVEQDWDVRDCPADLAESIDELFIETNRGLSHIASILADELADLDDLEQTTHDYLSDVEHVEAGDAAPDAAAEEAA